METHLMILVISRNIASP